MVEHVGDLKIRKTEKAQNCPPRQEFDGGELHLHLLLPGHLECEGQQDQRARRFVQPSHTPPDVWGNGEQIEASPL